MKTKKEIIEKLYKKYPRKEAELFEQVLIPILKAQRQKFKRVIEKEIKKYKCGKHKRLLKVLKDL